MKIQVCEELMLCNKLEYIVVPYLEEQESFASILNCFCFEKKEKEQLEEAFKNKDRKIILPYKNGIAQIELIAVRKQGRSIEESIRLTFMELGRRQNSSCQIFMICFEQQSKRDDLAQLVMQSIIEGSYSFGKEKLVLLKEKNIYQIRELLTKEKEELEFTFITRQIVKEAIKRGYQIGHSINLARTLGNLPNNFLHVKEFARYVKSMVAENNLEIEILGDKQLHNLSCGGILAVNQGNSEDANLIVLTYRGAEEKPFRALIGKGVLFDSGGYHLKNIGGMEGMKFDMCGAANIVSVMEVLSKQKERINVMAIIPLVENVISPNALKMGDVITTMSQKSVEIYNTDAEGRLILCDAITYAIQKKAVEIIDLATLTYSCQLALGSYMSGIFANEESSYQRFMEAVRQTGEKVWRLPLDPLYHEPIKHTQTADLINYAPDYGAGASIAASFLEEFVPEHLPWIHLDIVGTAVRREENPISATGATGVLIAAIINYLTRDKEEAYGKN